MMNLHLGYLPGCIGRIAEMHATCYARTVDFGAPFEAKVAIDGSRAQRGAQWGKEVNEQLFTLGDE